MAPRVSAAFQPVGAAERSRRVAVLLNARARRVTRDVMAQARFLVPGPDLFISHDFGAARAIAQTVIERGYDAVLAGGGDGTFTRCVSDLHALASQHGRRAPAVGVLRLGTGNAMADALGVGPERALDDVVGSARSAPMRPLELLQVAGQLAPFAGIGLDAQILDDYARVNGLLDRLRLRFLPEGLWRYGIAVATRSIPRFLFGQRAVVTAVNAGAPALRLGPDGQPTGSPIPAGEVLYRGPVSLASASTIPFYGFGMRIFPFARAMPGRFQLRLADCGTFEILWHLQALFQGTYRSPRIRDFLCDRVTLFVDRPAALQVGGDLCGRSQTVHLALAPRPVQTVS